MPKTALRIDGRKADQMRKITIEPGVAPAAAGSVLISCGNTKVICAVSIDSEVPRWMKQKKVEGGWLTAEYSMLPYSTTERNKREVSSGKVGGRTSEIQRLIGRALRAIVDMKKLGERTIWIDCDVLQADGGTRTASITGAYVALQIAVRKLMETGALKENPVREALAAISVGVVQGKPLLDLCYAEDVEAEVDMNIVMTASGCFIELQGTAEKEPFAASVLQKLIALGEKGCSELLHEQKLALAGK